MKKRILSLALLVAFMTVLLGVTSVSFASGTNLLENGNFENETIDPWCSHAGQFAGKDEFTHSGSGSLVAVADGVIYNKVLSAEGNKQYLFSAWVSPAMDDMRIAASLRNMKAVDNSSGQWCDKNGNPVNYWIMDSTVFMNRFSKEQWHLIETVVTTPEDASEMWLEFSAFDPGTVWGQSVLRKYFIDDVYFGEIVADGVISGKNVIQSDINPVSENYNITIGNIQGGTAGISATDIVVNSVAVDSASLEKGVTFENGVLTVPTSYEDYTITLTADVSGKVNGEDVNFVKTKEIEVIGFNPYLNMLENGDFEEGKTGDWTGAFEIKEYAEESDNGKSYAYGSELYYLGINDFPKDNGKYYILNADFNPGSEEKDIKFGFGTFASHNEAFTKKTFSGDNWYNEQIVAKRESYENGDGVYLKPEISISVWDAGAWTMNNGYKASFDNISLCELNAIAEIGGENVLNASMTDITSQYLVDVKNNFGTTVGIGTTTSKWSLKEAYEGVSIDEDTGVLTVTPTIESGEITIVCEAESVIQTNSGNAMVDTTDKLVSETEKTIELKAYDPYANMVKNGDFETGNKEGFAGTCNIKNWEPADVKGGSYSAFGGELYYQMPDFPKDNGKYYILNADFMPAEQTMDIHIGLSTFSSHNEALVMGTFEKDRWYNAQVVAKRESYENGEGTYLAPEIAISAWDAGAWTMNNNNRAYFDNLYLCELKAIATLFGDDEITVAADSVASNYRVDVANNFGGYAGIGTTTTVYSLKEAYEGVTIDESTGVVTVSPCAKTGEITVVASSVSKIVTTYNNGRKEEADSLTSTAEKTIKINSSLSDENSVLKADFSNATFEDGKTPEFIVALYDGTELVKVVSFTSRAFEFDYSEFDVDNAKIFTWNTLGSLEPLKAVIPYKLK